MDYIISGPSYKVEKMKLSLKTDEKIYSTSELSPDPSISSFSNNFHPLHILYKKERSTGYLAKR